MLTIDQVKQQTQHRLLQAQACFVESPTALHWTQAEWVALAHQQLHYFKGDTQPLLERLTDLPDVFWDEAIVRHCTGHSIRDLLHPTT